MDWVDWIFFSLCISIFLLMIGGIVYSVWSTSRDSKRDVFINNSTFPQSILNKLTERYPHLDNNDASRIIAGLRNYFLICNQAHRKMVAMPSRSVDFAWHEFILFTRQYQQFCQQAFGRFLHHTPAEAMPSKTDDSASIRYAWRLACAQEKLPRRGSHQLPVLFGLDQQLNIPDGFHYTLNCETHKNQGFCTTYISCAANCAGATNAWDSCSSSGCSGGSCSSCGGD